ncbi:Protein FAM49A [Tupaia chinensis]|nr:Protein FAM49A [Tupaia chinensis]
MWMLLQGGSSHVQGAQEQEQLCYCLGLNLQCLSAKARGDVVSVVDKPAPSCRRSALLHSLRAVMFAEVQIGASALATLAHMLGEPDTRHGALLPIVQASHSLLFGVVLCKHQDQFAGMGNLLKVLTREIENYPHFFLDFENAQPTEGEREIWNQISAVLQDSESILTDLQAYKGAGPEIRDAIQNPNDIQLQEKAWNAVCPLVVRLKRFYEFSIRLEKALQSLLESLTCPPYTPTQHLEREQALAKEFAEILHFTLRFDELKMRNPAIQNDFSYYRRTISRNRINNMHLDIENEVNNEMANRMSLFYAEATPMLKTLSNATMHFVSENKTLPIENTTDCLSTMTSVCKVMLETPEYRSRFTSEETLMFCMRVMVGVIILYDHVHPVGAFCKTSKIDMKGCIKVLKEQAPDSVEGLLNALRFTTKHLNDESTSKQIRAMLQ